MAGDTANPRIWVGADVYVGPLGSTAPTDVSTALNAAFIPLGLLAEDSPALTSGSDETDFYAHGGVYIRTIRSKFKNQLKVIALEDNKTVWQLRNPGSTVSSASAITTRVYKTPVSNPQAMVLHLVDGAVITRKVFAKVDLVDVADVQLGDSDIMAPEMTFNIFTDTAGVWGREITNDPAAVVP